MNAVYRKENRPAYFFMLVPGALFRNLENAEEARFDKQRRRKLHTARGYSSREYGRNIEHCGRNKGERSELPSFLAAGEIFF